jgi:hypothetical protein
MVPGRGTLKSRVSKHNKKDEKKMGAPHYVKAPVNGEQLHGGFKYTTGEVLTPQEEERLANIVNGLVYTARAALWFNPETDRGSSGAKAFGEPLAVDGKPVKYVLPDEAAIFPPREVA